MANVAVSLADGGGKEVKTDSTWGWVKSLEKGVSSLAVNGEKIGSMVNTIGSVVSNIFGGSDKSNSEKPVSSSSLLPLLVLGGGLALILK